MSELSTPPEFKSPPAKVVSLVPSMTESLFALGFGDSIVGITDYCIHPAAALIDLKRVGGPKNPNLDVVKGLKPDLVFVNQEENTPQAIEGLKDAGLPVWMTFPRGVDDAMEVLWTLLGIYHSDDTAPMIKTMQMTLDWAKSASATQPKIKYFCPIWQDETTDGIPWWMTFNQETYAGDLLSLFGGENCFADRKRRYPLSADLGEAEKKEDKGDTRYPRVTKDEILGTEPELILLPSEPFAFNDSHLKEINATFSETPAVNNQKVYLVDGSLITWHGTRMGMALQELVVFFE